jgi:precorrin-6x reductase
MFKCSGAEILVTKDSGEPGGFREKIEAAAEIGMTVIVVGRPSAENGYTEEEVIQLVKKRYALRINNHIGKEE